MMPPPPSLLQEAYDGDEFARLALADWYADQGDPDRDDFWRTVRLKPCKADHVSPEFSDTYPELKHSWDWLTNMSVWEFYFPGRMRAHMIEGLFQKLNRSITTPKVYYQEYASLEEAYEDLFEAWLTCGRKFS